MRVMIVLWRLLIIFVVGIVLFSIINYHIPLSGKKIIQYDFRAPDGTISHLYPVARVRDMAHADGRTYRSMIEDPVYLDIRTLVPYQSAAIDLVYDNKTAIPLKVGMKLRNSNSSFELKALTQERHEGGWVHGSVQFDLSQASYYNKKYTTVFSVPGLRAEMTAAGEVRMTHMTLTLRRPPLSWDDIRLLWKKF